MRPGEVLDAQMDLIDRLEDKQFQGAIDYLVAFHIGHAPVYDPIGTVLPAELREARRRVADEITDKYRGVYQNLQRTTQASYAYRVTADMCSMVEFAASQLNEEDEFDYSLAPTGCGIVCFDKPLPVKDARGKMMLIHWLVWGPSWDPAKPGATVFDFNDTWRQPDEVQEYMRESTVADHGQEAWDRVSRMQGRWATVGMSLLPNGEPMGPAVWTPSAEIAASIREEGFEPTEGTNTMRYLHALWLLLNQTVTKVEDDEVPDRPARRRAVKRGLPPKVTVIRLRREVSSLDREPGESLVEWQHRWMVRGHWRWQAYGPGRSERKRIWINPFVKGPEDAPLKQSEKVYSLDR